MNDKIALITGVTGQDGSYLVELLLEKGYEVHGLLRRASQFNWDRVEKIREEARKEGKTCEFYYGDLADASSINSILSKVRPTELYNLAAQSHVQISFEIPEYTADIDGIGVLRLLEGLRINNLHNTKLYQASTSELYGKVVEVPQTEKTPFYPRSPYGVAKMYGYWIVKNYREAYDMHASNGILFNHESPRRGKNFVSRKITYSLARIRSGEQETLRLGNLEAQRDWGYTRDYVEMMWMMLQQENPDDYVVATGEMHSVREFVDKASKIAGYELEWEGEKDQEKGRDKKTGKLIVEVDPKFYRPAEVDQLLGDPTKAKRQLGWEPKVRFDQLVEIMMENDLRACFT